MNYQKEGKIKKDADFYGEVVKLFEDKFQPVEPFDFYETLFSNHVQTSKRDFNNNKPNIVVVDRRNKKSGTSYFSKAQPLDKEIFEKHIFNKTNMFLNPCSFFGNRASYERLNEVYTMVVDIDQMYNLDNYKKLIQEIYNKSIVKPSFIVLSGHGCHLYFLFKRPYKITKDNCKLIEALNWLNKVLAKSIYTPEISSRIRFNKGINSFVSSPDIHSIVQGYRAVGSKNKFGSVIRAFKTNAYYEDANELILNIMKSKRGARKLKSMEAINFICYFDALKNDKIIFNEQNKIDKEDSKLFLDALYENRKNDPYYNKLLSIAPAFYEKVLNEAVEGGRYNCLYQVVVNEIKLGHSDGDIIKLLDYAILKLNEKAKKNKQSLLTEKDRNSLLSLLRPKIKLELLNLHINGEYLSDRTKLSIRSVEYKEYIEKRKEDGKYWKPDFDFYRSKNRVLILKYKVNNPEDELLDRNKIGKLIGISPKYISMYKDSVIKEYRGLTETYGYSTEVLEEEIKKICDVKKENKQIEKEKKGKDYVYFKILFGTEEDLISKLSKLSLRQLKQLSKVRSDKIVKKISKKEKTIKFIILEQNKMLVFKKDDLFCDHIENISYFETEQYRKIIEKNKNLRNTNLLSKYDFDLMIPPKAKFYFENDFYSFLYNQANDTNQNIARFSIS